MRIPLILLASVALLAQAVPALAQTPIDVRPRQPGPADAIEIRLSGYEEGGCPPAFRLQGVRRGLVVLRGDVLLPAAPCPPGPWTDTVVVPPLLPGSYRIEARITGPALKDYLHAVTSIEVKPPDELLSLHDGSFVAFIEWCIPGGNCGLGFAKVITSESGWFWFFSPDNLEVTLKVLDGRAVNGHWWIFLASMTDVEFTVTVFDNRTGCRALPWIPTPCPIWTYTSLPSVNANRLDTRAFPAEP
jgi:hypothetical protein